MDQLLDTPVELLDRHLEANVMAPVILTRLVLPGMVERRAGVVVNLSTSTRDLLLDAAARLYSERGIDNVSIAEIVRAANQRNASAVHYHFGSRDEVLRALLARHVPVIAARRRQLLEEARARPDGDARSAAEAIVRPVTEFAQRGWRERAYLRIGSEMTGAVDRTTPEIRGLLARTEGHQARALLRRRCPGVPADLWRVQREICIGFIGRAAADRARRLDRCDTRGGLSDDRFVANLVDMVMGAMSAPHVGGCTRSSRTGGAPAADAGGPHPPGGLLAVRLQSAYGRSIRGGPVASRESELWNEVSALLDAREGWSLQSSPTPGVPPTWGFVSEGEIELSVGIEEGLVAVYLVDRGVVITAPDVGGLTTWLDANEELFLQRHAMATELFDELLNGRVTKW